MKEVSLKILLSASSHSRFLCKHHRLLAALPVLYEAAHFCYTSCFRFIDSIPESIHFSPTASASCFLHTRFPQYASLIAFPCSLYRFHLVYYASFALRSFAFRITLTWYIPNTINTFHGTTASFCQNYIFFGTGLLFQFLWSLPKPKSSIENSFVGLYLHSIPCINILVDDSLFSVHQCQNPRLS